jgi:hypothetical protein
MLYMRQESILDAIYPRVKSMTVLSLIGVGGMIMIMPYLSSQHISAESFHTEGTFSGIS